MLSTILFAGLFPRFPVFFNNTAEKSGMLPGGCQNAVHAVTVHIHYFEGNFLPLEPFADKGNVSQACHDKSAECVILGGIFGGYLADSPVPPKAPARIPIRVMPICTVERKRSG